ncbi:hypothetical protein ACO22_00034 [Paracoccidioides brasiliensis]|uniref:Uncharacterized protein n=1 Tax=Paracoccidioides brasiliensis TaxID=121759 RepID=A0A1D2JQT9_PARBR|nr:hypothetical protein ACO22_00034 [Paracoccidioides brasiliensis]
MSSRATTSNLEEGRITPRETSSLIIVGFAPESERPAVCQILWTPLKPAAGEFEKGYCKQQENECRSNSQKLECLTLIDKPLAIEVGG